MTQSEIAAALGAVSIDRPCVLCVCECVCMCVCVCVCVQVSLTLIIAEKEC